MKERVGERSGSGVEGGREKGFWADAFAVCRMLSGGAEASIFLWDLQRGELGRDEDVGDKEIFVNRPVGAVKKYV